MFGMLQDVYEQSLDDGYEYSQNVYDDDDEEQPVARRQQGYGHYAAADSERRISQHSNQGSSPQVLTSCPSPCQTDFTQPCFSVGGWHSPPTPDSTFCGVLCLSCYCSVHDVVGMKGKVVCFSLLLSYVILIYSKLASTGCGVFRYSKVVGDF